MADEAITDTMRIDFLEKLIRKSYTGVSLDWIPSVEEEPSGYRVLTFHNLREPQRSLRSAIDTALTQESV